MKVVIISDLHGNYDALSALPERGDELWVLGDLVNYGPQPAEVVDFVKQQASAVVRGNHDHAVAFDEDPRCTPRYRAMARATGEFSASVLTAGQKQFLGNLPLSLATERKGTRFYLCHAMPSNPLYGYCPAESETWARELASLPADVLLVGHTHTPFVRQVGNQVVANPGSLGQPKTGGPDACYAVWEDGTLELRSFPYPVAKTVARIQALPVPAEVKSDLITVLSTGGI